MGESVAAGYLYAPWYTPAGVLAELLPTWDVLDLAKTNESLADLATTVGQGLQLEPDVVVMWAGNNWLLRDLAELSPYHPDTHHRVAIGAALGSGGPGSLEPFVTEELHRSVLPRLDSIRAMVEDAGATLLVVIPEVNLVDWHSHQPVPVLPSGRESDWHDALAAGDGPRMAAIDDAAAASTWRTLGDALPTGPERLDAYRREVALSAGPLRAVTASPMATTAVQQLLRQWSAERDVGTVDVAELIGSVEELPDRRWFLDYCHHTHPAIESIMTAVARHIGAGALGAASPPPAELQAVAALGALVHTDHRLVSAVDRIPLLRHWREVAIEVWDGAADLIDDLVDSRLAPAVLPVTDAQRRNQGRPFPFGFAHGWRPLFAEHDALVALGRTTPPAEPLVPAERAWPASARLRPGSVLWRDEQSAGTTRAFLRSVWPVSEFAVAASTGAAVDLTLTVRAPAQGEIGLSLGEWSATAGVGTAWSTARFRIPPDAAPPGPQVLRVRWPRLPEGGGRWDALLSALTSGEPGRLHPVFGEVFSLRIE